MLGTDPSKMKDKIKSDMPICGKCKKPVDRVQKDYNMQTREVIFIVSCHGEQETIKINDQSYKEHVLYGLEHAFKVDSEKDVDTGSGSE